MGNSLIDDTLQVISKDYKVGLLLWLKNQPDQWARMLGLEDEINRTAFISDTKSLRSALEACKSFFSKCSTSYAETGFVVQGDLFKTETQKQSAEAKPPQVQTLSEKGNDMKFSKMFPSNYFSKDDLEQPQIVTIKDVILETIKTEDGEREKPVIYFEDDWKPMILNKSNGEVLSDAFGDDSDDWAAQVIELFVDPNIRFGSKKVGGIRVRVPNTSSVETPF